MTTLSEEEFEKLLKNTKVKVHDYNKATMYHGQTKPSKYRNQRTKIDGVLFDSKKEAEYYSYLRMMLLAHEIIAFNRQVEFILQEGHDAVKPITYIADFLVIDKQRHPFYIDVKGMKTDTYKMKKKMLLAKYNGIDFREV